MGKQELQLKNENLLMQMLQMVKDRNDLFLFIDIETLYRYENDAVCRDDMDINI